MQSFLSSARHQVGMDLKRNGVREHGSEEGKRVREFFGTLGISNCFMHAKLRDDLMLLVKNGVEERKEDVGFLVFKLQKVEK
jgi:hypothetical protein